MRRVVLLAVAGVFLISGVAFASGTYTGKLTQTLKGHGTHRFSFYLQATSTNVILLEFHVSYVCSGGQFLKNASTYAPKISIPINSQKVDDKLKVAPRDFVTLKATFKGKTVSGTLVETFLTNKFHPPAKNNSCTTHAVSFRAST